MKMNEQNRNLLILLSICVLTIFPLLGLTDYNTKGEPREAIVAYSMLEHGNWILPRNYGGEIAFKPPIKSSAASDVYKRQGCRYLLVLCQT